MMTKWTSDHAGKAAILWEAYQKRMGTSEKTTILHFDLESLYAQQIDALVFVNLELPFMEEEVNQVVKELPMDKSLDPDGFNNEFFKIMLGHYQS